MTTQNPQSPTKPPEKPQSAREKRLAEALRQNLLRRRAAASAPSDKKD